MKKPNKKFIFWIGLLFCGTACGAFLWFDTFTTPPPPVRPSSAVPKIPAAPKVPAADATQAVAPPLVNTPITVSPEVPIAVSGNLRTLTALRAGLEETKLRAAMNELDAKMKKNESSAPVMPMAVTPPPLLPDLPPPVASPRIRAGVISVQGLDGKLTATVRTGAGKTMTVRPGDRVAGMGTVTSISRNGVAFKGESGSHTLNFD